MQNEPKNPEKIPDNRGAFNRAGEPQIRASCREEPRGPAIDPRVAQQHYHRIARFGR